jgi:hypothetical protein
LVRGLVDQNDLLGDSARIADHAYSSAPYASAQKSANPRRVASGFSRKINGRRLSSA